MLRRKTKKRNIRDRDKRQLINFTPTLVLFTLSILIFTITQLVYLSLFGTRGADISQIQLAKQEIIQDIKDVDSTISEMKSLTRIEEVAESDLGLLREDDIRLVTNTEHLGVDISDQIAE